MAVPIETRAEPIPGYQLIERLGGGGFGEVWKASAPGGILKAIKFVYGDLQTESHEDAQRAEQELKALRRVQQVRHPYILSLERYDIVEGQLLIVMELADRNLWDRFRECRNQGLPGIPREELLRYMSEAAEALDLMNIEHQLQHLDIKPQNLFLVHSHAKVADFGLVKDLEGMMASVTGGVTPVYAAPETFDGWVSRYCDQYSLAIVYEELLTGQRPFNGNNVRQLIMQHLQAAPNLSPLPACDREVVGRALSKNPDERFPTCQAFVQALRSAGGSGVHAAVKLAAEPERPADGGSRATMRRDAVQEAQLQDSDLPEELPSDDDAGMSPVVQTAVETRWIRVHEGAEPVGDDTPPLTRLREEVRGPGLLFPALVIGVGELGLASVQRLRERLQQRFGSLEAVPNIRTLYLDTDPEAARRATDGGPGTALSGAEVILARLHRPSHYLRSQRGRAIMEACFDPKMLYRIPRSLVTTGLRALGRLAFLDNYRLIVSRLRRELEAVASEDSLHQATVETGLGLRTNRLRVYVVSGLAGGTGGGMFLDLAYVLRQLLKEMGYEQPETVGLFLVPPVDRNPNQTLALGNVFAALTELNHFSAPGTTFTAKYDEKQRAVRDNDAPYSRCVVLPLPQDTEGKAAREAVGLPADFLYRDLTTLLGRLADERRAAAPTQSRQPWGLACQTFGVYRISWPRQGLVKQVAGRLCKQLAERWKSKDAAPVRERVQESVGGLWAKIRLDGEHLLADLTEACTQAMGQAPEGLLAAAVQPLDGLQDATQTADIVAQVMDRLENVLGRPDSTASARQPVLYEPLHSAADKLIHDWGNRLTAYTDSLIEQPEFRLAGAEEAVRQLVVHLESELHRYEPLGKELTTRTADALDRIRTIQACLADPAAASRRTSVALANLAELIGAYSRWRYQSLIQQRLGNVYVSLRGRLSDQLREINFCRARLSELIARLDDPGQAIMAGDNGALGQDIYPAGCRTMDEAVQHLLKAVSPEDLQSLDGRMQDLIEQQFKTLAQVCLGSANMLENLHVLMQQTAERFANDRLGGLDIADMYLTHHADEGQVEADLALAFQEAAPALAGQRPSTEGEICFLALPANEAGQRLRTRALPAIACSELGVIEGSEDIACYREVPQLFLSDLEQLGPLALAAYRQMVAVEHFTPHTRTDIHRWRAATAG
jgi:eukaryotic-like serine/threonine-protein kinase